MISDEEYQRSSFDRECLDETQDLQNLERIEKEASRQRQRQREQDEEEEARERERQKQRKAEEAARETARKELEYAAPADFAMAAGHALTDAEKYVLEQKGTEAAGTGTYEGFFPTDGYFACRKCGAPIYSAKSKFESGCGWPAFDKCYEGAVEHRVETDGTERIEIVCAHCKGHLGHIFMGEAKTATGERHCANSRALQFVKAKVDKKEVKLGPLD